MGIELNGKVLLITGGGSGIGQATALAGARAGARVVVADWDAEAAAKTVATIEAEGGQGLAVRTDVSKSSDVESLLQQIRAAYGRLDCAVNNAGVQGLIADTAECTEENWDYVININLKGVWLCMKHEILQMLEQGGGRIVNVASNMGLVGHPGMPAYSASKHALIGLTKTAALEYANKNIFVNVVCPGPTATPFADGIVRRQPDMMARLMKGAEYKLVMGRLGLAEEIAPAILWCCSDDSRYMVGSVISVDGGYVAQ